MTVEEVMSFVTTFILLNHLFIICIFFIYAILFGFLLVGTHPCSSALSKIYPIARYLTFKNIFTEMFVSTK